MTTTPTPVPMAERHDMKGVMTVVSCKECERTFGDSSCWVESHRELGAVSFSKLKFVTIGEEIQLVKAGTWDEYSELFTVFVDRIREYTFNSSEGSLPIAKSIEIAKVLHPEPDELVLQNVKIRQFLVILSDEIANLKQTVQSVDTFVATFNKRLESIESLLDINTTQSVQPNAEVPRKEETTPVKAAHPQSSHGGNLQRSDRSTSNVSDDQDQRSKPSNRRHSRPNSSGLHPRIITDSNDEDSDSRDEGSKKTDSNDNRRQEGSRSPSVEEIGSKSFDDMRQNSSDRAKPSVHARRKRPRYTR